MSVYGLEVYDPLGRTRLSITDQTVRLVAVRSVAALTSSSWTFPGLSTKSPIATAVAYQTIYNGYPVKAHTVSISGDTVTATPPTYFSGGLDFPGANSLVWIFARS